MPKVFISYRRADSKHAAGRIGDKLVDAFGRDSVLKDVDTLPLGLDFRNELKKLIPQADVLLAIIGDKWLTAADAEGNRRLDNEADWVRMEIETALQCNIPVVPLLIGTARMPKPDELPASLAPLAYRHGTKIGADPLFRQDFERLIKALEKTLRQSAIQAAIVSSAATASPAAALDLQVAELVAATPASPFKAPAACPPLPSDWVALRWGLIVAGLIFLSVVAVGVVIAVIAQEHAEEARRKKLIEDMSKNLPSLMPAPSPPPDYRGLLPPDYKGLLPPDSPSPSIEEVLRQSLENEGLGAPPPERNVSPGESEKIVP